jgi:outer membrane translocation and assembly module TamA
MKNLGRSLLLVACSVLAAAEIIDRIAISAGNQAITESQIDEEVRLTAFLNGEKVDLSSAERKKAADRLIEQALVKREMELSRYPLPPMSDAEKQLEALKKGYASEAQFDNKLRSYGITEDELSKRLFWQLTVLRFVEFRFRPGIQIQDSDVRAYYKKESDKWQQEGTKTIPSLEQARSQIVDILTEQRIDEALDSWLKEARRQAAIRYLDESLQ